MSWAGLDVPLSLAQADQLFDEGANAFGDRIGLHRFRHVSDRGIDLSKDGFGTIRKNQLSARIEQCLWCVPLSERVRDSQSVGVRKEEADFIVALP